MLRSKWLALYLACVAIMLIAFYVFPASKIISIGNIEVFDNIIQNNSELSTIALFFISAILTYFAFPSMPVIYVATGYCINSLYGVGAVLFGSAFGGLGAFLLYRKHIPHRFRAPPKRQSSLKLWLTLLGLRLSPIVPAPLVNFVAAFFDASAAQYMTTTIVGSAPLIVFYNVVGAQGHHYVNGERIQWWYVGGYLAILAVSTFLSALGPWRSFLSAIKLLKNEVVTSIAQSPPKERAASNAAGQAGD